MIEVVRHPFGPRVYLAGRRVHHGSAGIGVALLALATRRPLLAAFGLAMSAHDARDFPWRDRDNHPPRSGGAPSRTTVQIERSNAQCQTAS